MRSRSGYVLEREDSSQLVHGRKEGYLYKHPVGRAFGKVRKRYIILLPGEGQRSPTKSLCAPENLVLDGGTAVIAIDVDDPDLDVDGLVRDLPPSTGPAKAGAPQAAAQRLARASAA